MASAFSSPLARGINWLATVLINAPLLGGFVRRGMVTIRYVGRRSGKTFELPVAYRRSGGAIVIGVGMPDRKAWWRNFLGEGGPITLLQLDGRERSGHAVAARDDGGGVSVTVRLDES